MEKLIYKKVRLEEEKILTANLIKLKKNAYGEYAVFKKDNQIFCLSHKMLINSIKQFLNISIYNRQYSIRRDVRITYKGEKTSKAGHKYKDILVEFL